MHASILFFGTRGAIPAVGDGHTTFLLRFPAPSGGRRWLVDVSGSPVRDLMRLGLGPEELDGVVLTHAHADHLYGFPMLVHTLRGMGRRARLGVVAAEDARRVARGLLELFRVDPDRPGFELDWREGWSDPQVRIELFPSRHSIPGSMARFRAADVSLLYTSDTLDGPWVREAARGCGVLVHEASGPHAQMERLLRFAHSSARQAGANAREAGARQLFLCHFGEAPEFAPRRMGREAAREFRGRVVVPRPYRGYRLEAGPAAAQGPAGTEAR